MSSAGPFVDRFEREVAQYVGVPHAVATVNGTAALHVALLAAGVGPGDEVLVPTFTFVATANAVAYCGAHPVFLDCEETSWGLDPGALAEFLDGECEVEGGTRGEPAQRPDGPRAAPGASLRPPVRSRSRCSRWPGATRWRWWRTRRRRSARATAAARSAVDGLAGCLSFNGNKIITTGAGGMVLTRDEATGRAGAPSSPPRRAATRSSSSTTRSASTTG